MLRFRLRDYSDAGLVDKHLSTPVPVDSAGRSGLSSRCSLASTVSSSMVVERGFVTWAPANGVVCSSRLKGSRTPRRAKRPWPLTERRVDDDHGSPIAVTEASVDLCFTSWTPIGVLALTTADQC